MLPETFNPAATIKKIFIYHLSILNVSQDPFSMVKTQLLKKTTTQKTEKREDENGDMF